MSKYDGVRVVAQIDLCAIAFNVRKIKNRLRDGAWLIAVIKADGYGHGAVEVAKTALENGADALGVAIVDEGLDIRRSGITAPILILGHTPPGDGIESAVKANLIQTVSTTEMAREISSVAVRLKTEAYVHIKIDTGMGRLGFLPTQDTITEITNICSMKGLVVAGIYSHFACADEVDKAYTLWQKKQFDDLVDALSRRGMTFPIKHISNSAAYAADDSSFGSDSVRAGIIIYGLSPFGTEVRHNLSLIPAMSLRSSISHIKTLEAGCCISYGSTYRTNRVAQIATVPVGYADGYMRAMSNNGRVLIRGQYAPIVGRICMDQFMVDITGIDGVKLWDEVVLIGSQGENRITVDELATRCGTINYEIVCMISKRVPRSYIIKDSNTRE